MVHAVLSSPFGKLHAVAPPRDLPSTAPALAETGTPTCVTRSPLYQPAPFRPVFGAEMAMDLSLPLDDVDMPLHRERLCWLLSHGYDGAAGVHTATARLADVDRWVGTVTGP